MMDRKSYRAKRKLFLRFVIQICKHKCVAGRLFDFLANLVTYHGRQGEANTTISIAFRMFVASKTHVNTMWSPTDLPRWPIIRAGYP